MTELQNYRQGKSSIAPTFSKRGYNKLHSPKLSMKVCKLEQNEGGFLFINRHATILAQCHVSTPLWFPIADNGNQIKTIENKHLTLLLEDFPALRLVSN